MDKILQKSDFDPHLNTEFEISNDDAGSINIQLIEIDSWDKDMTEGFSLLFKGPKENVMPHDTLKMKHDSMGEFDIFIGPVIYPKQDGVYYEAIFNRLKENL
jgi:hypothetical protein